MLSNLLKTIVQKLTKLKLTNLLRYGNVPDIISTKEQSNEYHDRE